MIVIRCGHLDWLRIALLLKLDLISNINHISIYKAPHTEYTRKTTLVFLFVSIFKIPFIFVSICLIFLVVNYTHARLHDKYDYRDRPPNACAHMHITQCKQHTRVNARARTHTQCTHTHTHTYTHTHTHTHTHTQTHNAKQNKLFYKCKEGGKKRESHPNIQSI